MSISNKVMLKALEFLTSQGYECSDLTSEREKHGWFDIAAVDLNDEDSALHLIDVDYDYNKFPDNPYTREEIERDMATCLSNSYYYGKVVYDRIEFNILDNEKAFVRFIHNALE